MAGVECVFKVGDHVKLIHRTGGVVVKIDRAGNSGLGQIDVRFPDGAVTSGIFPTADLSEKADGASHPPQYMRLTPMFGSHLAGVRLSLTF